MADPTTPSPAPAPPPAEIKMPQAEVESGKVMAILCYLLNPLVPIICLATKNNSFALFHAKQALVLAIAVSALSIVNTPLSCIVIGLFLWPVIGLVGIIFSILGLVNAAQGKAKLLPLIGGYGEKWFASIKKG